MRLCFASTLFSALKLLTRSLIQDSHNSINTFLLWKEFLTQVWEEKFSFSLNLLSIQSSLLLSTAPQNFSPQGGVSIASNYPNFFISSLYHQLCPNLPLFALSARFCAITDGSSQDENHHDFLFSPCIISSLICA